jgi:hypothetical protein
VFDFDSSTPSSEDCQQATVPTEYDTVSACYERAVAQASSELLSPRDRRAVARASSEVLSPRDRRAAARASSEVLSPRDRRAAARASSSVISPQGKRALAQDTASKPSADAESNVLSPRDKRALFRATNTISTATTTTAVHAMADTTTLHENESQDEPSTTANPTTALEAQHENALVEYEPESPLPDRILGNPRNANLPYNALDIYHVLSPFPMNVLQVLSPVQQTPYGTVCHVTFPPIAPVDCQMHEEQILNDNIEEATNNSNNSLNDSGVDETSTTHSG